MEALRKRHRPVIWSAIFFRLILRVRFILREWIFRMSCRAASLGLGNSICSAGMWQRPRELLVKQKDMLQVLLVRTKGYASGAATSLCTSGPDRQLRWVEAYSLGSHPQIQLRGILHHTHRFSSLGSSFGHGKCSKPSNMQATCSSGSLKPGAAYCRPCVQHAPSSARFGSRDGQLSGLC